MIYDYYSAFVTSRSNSNPTAKFDSAGSTIEVEKKLSQSHGMVRVHKIILSKPWSMVPLNGPCAVVSSSPCCGLILILIYEYLLRFGASWI